MKLCLLEMTVKIHTQHLKTVTGYRIPEQGQNQKTYYHRRGKSYGTPTPRLILQQLASIRKPINFKEGGESSFISQYLLIIFCISNYCV